MLHGTIGNDDFERSERCNIVAILEGLGVMFTENGKLKLRVEQDRT